MTNYPMWVERYSARHRSGTKDYHAVLITRDGPSVLIKRWGKANASGQMDVRVFPTSEAARKAYDDVFREKFNNEYSQQLADPRPLKVDSQVELTKALGPQYRFTIGKEALLALDPNLDVSGVREPKITKYEKREDGSFREVHKPKLVEELPPDVYTKNPLWGSM